MPAEVINNPLAVSCVFSDARRFTLRLSQLPCRRLVADLANGIAAMVHPHGELDSRSTVVHYRTGLGLLAKSLDEAGFTGGAADLTRTQMIEFWMSAGPRWESKTRSLLRSWDERTDGLHPDLRAYLAGPALHQKAREQAFAPYSEGEWTRLRTACQSTVDAAFAEHRAALAASDTAGDPATAGWSLANLCWLLRHYGPLNVATIARHMDYSPEFKANNRIVPAHELLFPTARVVFAYRLLLGMTTGIVPDGPASLGLDDIDWAGEETILLDFLKGRTSREGLNLPRPAVKVLRQWLEHSALLRRFAPDALRSRLWIAYSPFAPGAGQRILVPRLLGHTVGRAWVAEHAVLGDDGAPLTIHKHRIRTTFDHRRDKRAWTGRTTLDPNRSAQVEGDHYLAQMTPAQQDALDAVIEDAQADLVRKAATPAKVLNSEDATAAAAALPEAIAGLHLTPAVIRELVGGQRDVFTAACADQLAGLHGPAGKPCPARPWVCLLCPLAVFAPRHAPNLLRLKGFFARQFRQMTTAQFLAVFGPYAHRLDDDILPRFSAAVLTAAAAEVTGTDDELPLRAEETTR